MVQKRYVEECRRIPQLLSKTLVLWARISSTRGVIVYHNDRCRNERKSVADNEFTVCNNRRGAANRDTPALNDFICRREVQYPQLLVVEGGYEWRKESHNIVAVADDGLLATLGNKHPAPQLHSRHNPRGTLHTERLTLSQLPSRKARESRQRAHIGKQSLGSRNALLAPLGSHNKAQQFGIGECSNTLCDKLIAHLSIVGCFHLSDGRSGPK